MPKSGIFKTVKGETVELSASQVKAEVMQIRGWTARQYEKEYDKIRNRIRAYEGFERLKGEKVTPESPAAFLYKESRAMQRHGADYTPSPRTAAIRQTIRRTKQSLIISSLQRISTQALSVFHSRSNSNMTRKPTAGRL